MVLGLAVLALVVSTLLIGRARRTRKEQWMRASVHPKIRGFVAAQKNYRAAFDLAGIAEQVITDDPTLAELRPEFTSLWSVTTEPPGADVYAKPYDRPQEDWQSLGRSPFDQVGDLSLGFFRWRVTEEGATPVEGFRDCPVEGRIQLTLDRKGEWPSGHGACFRKRLPGELQTTRMISRRWARKTIGSTAARSRTGSSRSLWIRAAVRERGYLETLPGPPHRGGGFCREHGRLAGVPAGTRRLATAGFTCSRKNRQNGSHRRDAMEQDLRDQTGKPRTVDVAVRDLPVE